MRILVTLLVAGCAVGARRGEVRDEAGRQRRGAVARVERSAAVRREFQRLHPCPAIGQPDGACPGYVVDHIRALKRGGEDAVSNMQWQPVAEARAKDRIE